MARPTATDNTTIAACYATALLVGAVTVMALPRQPTLIAAAGASLTATLTVFTYSRVTGNSSCYDAYWSLAPLALAGWWAWAWAGLPLRMAVCLALLGLWGLRLTYNWYSGWSGMSHVDWRYLQLREQTGRGWFFVDLFGIHLFPTGLVFIGMLGVHAATTGGRPVGAWDAVGVLFGLTSLFFEGIGDWQLRRFQRNRKTDDEVLDTGLWSWTRHPNYFGEICIWVSMAAFGTAARPDAGHVWFGPLVMCMLFVYISIPLLEKRMLAKRPQYAETQRRVSMLLPLPPRTTR